MINEELLKNLKKSMELYKEYLLNPESHATDDDKKLYAVMMFKFGTLLAAKKEYENMSQEDKLRVNLIAADAKAFVVTVNEFCLAV